VARTHALARDQMQLSKPSLQGGCNHIQKQASSCVVNVRLSHQEKEDLKRSSMQKLGPVELENADLSSHATSYAPARHMRNTQCAPTKDIKLTRRWAEARIKIARMTLTIKLDRNWSSFQLANSAPPLSVTGSAIAPSARIELSCNMHSTHERGIAMYTFVTCST
jgi:hypothetical protein